MANAGVDLPGQQIARRPLEFIWIADCSGSMSIDGKMQALNMAIRECIPHMQTAAAPNYNAQVRIRAIKFSSGAIWHIPTAVPVESFTWTDLSASGVTDMGKALSMVAEALDMANMPNRGLPPVLVLISDGQPTDGFQRGMDDLLSKPWGRKAVRIAIAIGRDADHTVLQKFIGDRFPEIPVLEAHNPHDLTNYIKWVSTAVLAAASASQVNANGAAAPTINIPAPPPTPTTSPSPGAGGGAPNPDIW